MKHIRKLLIGAVALGMATASQAATVVVNASGSFTSAQSRGSLGAGPVVGSPFALTLTFDTNSLSEIFRSDSTVVYGLVPTNFSATIGSVNFALETSQPPVLVLTSGFRFTGGPVSEAVFYQSFYFPGSNGPGAPITVSGGGSTLALTSIFPRGFTVTPLIPESLTNIGLAASNEVQFFAEDASGASRILLSGPATGQLSVSSVAAVPEPASWLMMILGIGGLGALLRRLGRQRPAAAAAM